MFEEKKSTSSKKQEQGLPHRGKYSLGICTVLMPLDSSEADRPAAKVCGKAVGCGRGGLYLDLLAAQGVCGLTALSSAGSTNWHLHGGLAMYLCKGADDCAVAAADPQHPCRSSLRAETGHCAPGTWQDRSSGK